MPTAPVPPSAGRGGQPAGQAGDLLPHFAGQIFPPGGRAGGRSQLRHTAFAERDGEHAAGPPHLVELLHRSADGLGQAAGLGQEKAHGGERRFTLPGVVRVRDVAQRAGDHLPSRVRVPDAGEADLHPERAPVPVPGRRGDTAAFLKQAGECLGGLALQLRPGPPGIRRGIRQPFRAEAEHARERRIDLNDRAGAVRDEEGLLQGVDHCCPPPGMMTAHVREPRMLPDAGQQLGGGKRLGQVVARAVSEAVQGRGVRPARPAAAGPAPPRWPDRRAARPPGPSRPGSASARC